MTERAYSERRAAPPTPQLEGRIDVRLEGVSKRYGDVTALRPTDLSVIGGEFFSLLGASGSGKTTTLRLIGGFEELTTGTIFLQGRDVTGSAPYDRNVNTVFQDYALFPHMSVHDNVAYGLRVKRVARKEIARRVRDILELVRLSGFERRRPSQLSGGQRQRVALARALVNSPAVLLLDEPLGALDLKLRRQMQAELRRIQHDVGITFIYVTHDQEEAMSMSDRVAVMRDGRIEQIGTPAEVYERPDSAFVAGFVGISNLFAGKVLGSDGAIEVEVHGCGVLRGVPRPGYERGDSIVLTIRPEKVRMSAAPVPSGPSNNLSGRILDVSYAGPFTRYTVTCGEREVSIIEQNEGLGPRAQLGEEVWLSWPVAQTFVLPGTDADVREGRIEATPAEQARVAG